MGLKLVRTEKPSEEDLERFEADQADFEWFAEHAEDLEEKYRGKYLAIANREAFIAESFREAVAKAKSKHPERDPYVEYIPLKRRVMIL